MSDFQRYAVYYLPGEGTLSSFGAKWLGWDIARGAQVEQFAIKGLEEATSTPRKYGFHGTLKPPFRLADGAAFDALKDEVQALAREMAPVRLDGLRLSQIGKFLALVPEGRTDAISGLAFACVARLDHMRRPPDPRELERRRANGLTARQEVLLRDYGYPYVADEFRFHLTLTGSLDPALMERMEAAARALLPEVPRPYMIGSIALVGERGDGMFEEVHRYTLAG